MGGEGETEVGARTEQHHGVPPSPFSPAGGWMEGRAYNRAVPVFSPGWPLARQLSRTAGTWGGGEGGLRQRKRERERSPETCESEPRLVRQTGGGGEGEILTSRFIRILMIPVREQYKAKETEIRPDVDGGEQSTGVARMGDRSRGGRVEMGTPGWTQKGGTRGMILWGAQGDANQVPAQT